MSGKDRFIDGETVSFDDEPTEVRRREDAPEDTPTVAQEIPAELVSATLPVSESDPDDPMLRDTVADPPPANAVASGELDTRPPDEDDPAEAEVDLTVRLSADMVDADSMVETVTEVVQKPADDLVIVFQDESVRDEDDDEFDGRETVERKPLPVTKQTVIGKRGQRPAAARVVSNDDTVARGKRPAPPEDPARQTQTRAGHRRARTKRGESAAGPLPLAPGAAERAPTEDRTTQRRPPQRKRQRESAARPDEDEITKIRGD